MSYADEDMCMKRRTYLAGFGGVFGVGLFTKESSSYCSTPSEFKVIGATDTTEDSVTIETVNASIDSIEWEFTDGRLLGLLSCSKDMCSREQEHTLSVPVDEYEIITRQILLLARVGDKQYKTVVMLIQPDSGALQIGYSGRDDF